MAKIIVLLASVFALPAMVRSQSNFTNNGSFKIVPGSSLNVTGNFTNNGTFIDSGLSVKFNGTSAQTISGTSTTTFNNLVIDNASGVSMQQGVTVTNTLSLTNGPLFLDSHMLYLTNSASSAIGRTSGYIVSEAANNSSKIKWKIGTDTSAHIFPLATTTGTYIPFKLTRSAGDIGNVTVSTYHTSFDNKPYPTSPVLVTHVNDSLGNDLSAIVVDRFWQVDKDGPSGTASMTFTATPAEVGTINNLMAQRWNQADKFWESPITGQTHTSNSVTVTGVTSFTLSTWAISDGGTMLAIEGLDFAAKPDGTQVSTQWTTEFETNCYFFTVEKSQDGKRFSSVARVTGAGNSTSTRKYQAMDEQPYPGLSYYRVKETHFDGSVSYSKLVAVYFNPERKFSLFPNPVYGNSVQISIDGYLGESMNLNLTDMSGQTVYSLCNVQLPQGRTTLSMEIPNSVAPGVYMMQITGMPQALCQKLIIE